MNHRYCPFSGVSNLTDPPIAREVIRPHGRNKAEHSTTEQASEDEPSSDKAEDRRPLMDSPRPDDDGLSGVPARI